MPSTPPNGLPVYRLITGKDDAGFCQRISRAWPWAISFMGRPV
ncbi:DUF1737 domain-containing protein [Pseudomonas mosselii]